MNYKCKCGNEKSFACEPKGPHIGLYCAKCNKWIKWITKDELQALLAIPGVLGLGMPEVTLRGALVDITITPDKAAIEISSHEAEQSKEGEEPW